MKVSSTSVDNFVATLRSDVVATLRHSDANFVTTLQSLNFTKYLTTSVKGSINFASANILEFLGKVLEW